MLVLKELAFLWGMRVPFPPLTGCPMLFLCLLEHHLSMSHPP